MTAYADVSSMLPFKKLHDTSGFPKKSYILLDEAKFIINEHCRKHLPPLINQ
jgi:hypothetical protein